MRRGVADAEHFFISAEGVTKVAVIRMISAETDNA
jgi:hypothetical protein